MNKVIVVILTTIVFGILLFVFLQMLSYVIDLSDAEEILNCAALKKMGYEIDFEKRTLFDKCYIIEEGSRITPKQHYNKHKYDVLGEVNQ